MKVPEAGVVSNNERARSMTKKNGFMWKVIGIGATALIGVGVYIATVQNNSKQIAEIQPEVKKNSEHRIQFEEKVSTMETNIGLILEEVRKE